MAICKDGQTIIWYIFCLYIYCCVVTRNGRGHSYLRDMLNPLITSLLDDKTVKINTNPIEVYKNWVNQQETESGVTRSVTHLSNIYGSVALVC